MKGRPPHFIQDQGRNYREQLRHKSSFPSRQETNTGTLFYFSISFSMYFKLKTNFVEVPLYFTDYKSSEPQSVSNFWSEFRSPWLFPLSILFLFVKPFVLYISSFQFRDISSPFCTILPEVGYFFLVRLIHTIIQIYKVGETLSSHIVILRKVRYINSHQYERWVNETYHWDCNFNSRVMKS